MDSMIFKHIIKYITLPKYIHGCVPWSNSRAWYIEKNSSIPSQKTMLDFPV